MTSISSEGPFWGFREVVFCCVGNRSMLFLWTGMLEVIQNKVNIFKEKYFYLKIFRVPQNVTMVTK